MIYDRLLYQGRASIRIITREGKVIYIDPFMGEGYDYPADLILVTHEHFDHNNIGLIRNKNKDCKIIRSSDALVNGEYKIFDLGYVKVEATEAGYNKNHNVNNCVGYIITLPSNISVYISGDTSTTKQMKNMAKRDIDYAFYCCDGVYNMDIEEAIEVAQLVKAKHSIPYHITGDITDGFDMDRAKKFHVHGRLILVNGQEVNLTRP